MTDTADHFDYIIIGNGLAGLQLALKMAEDVFFESKSIALIDASEKRANDKSWSFWEIGNGQWDAIVQKSWNHAQVITPEKSLDLGLQPYTYKTIRSIDFYNHAKGILTQKSNFHFIIDKVVSLNSGKTVQVITERKQVSAGHVFDSRIPEAYFSSENKHTNILQHFKGIFIKTATPQFNPSKFTMMDYRLKDGNQTSFTYVLPFSKTEALVEFTYFTSEIVDESTYDRYIKDYISDFLKVKEYTVTETEQGIIPMTTFPFESYSTDHVTKIGTGGSWVKASTGYSFKHTEKKVAKIIDNLKNNKLPSQNLFKKKYKFYDKIFLKVLKDENSKGEWIFQQFYSKNSVQTMFRFLDEESTFAEELKIMMSLFSWSFIKAFFKTL